MRSNFAAAYPQTPTLTRAVSATLSSRIVAEVRDALLAGTLNSGDVLGTEASLSEEFGVSRVAVRDALKCLEAMGVIRIRVGAGGGARIANSNIPLFADIVAIQLRLIDAKPGAILDAQRAIEMMTAELAALHASDEDLQRLELLLEEAEQELEDIEGFTRSGFAFHVAIADAAHNEVLKMQLLAMHYVAWPDHNPTLTPEVATHILNIHRELYSYIKLRDANGARDLMSDHLRQIRSRRVPDGTEAEIAAGCC